MRNFFIRSFKNKTMILGATAVVLLSFLVGSSVEACASLALHKYGPDFAEPGEMITYKLEWKAKNDPQTNIVLIDALPAKTTFVSATGIYSISGNQVTWTYDNAAAGEWGEEQIIVKVDDYTYDTDILVNQATVKSNEADQVSAEKQTEIDARCQLSISKVADAAEVDLGGQINYTVAYENKGNGVCVGTGVMLGEYLDERTDFVSAAPEAPHYTALDFPYSEMPGTLGEADYLWQWEELIPDGQHTMSVTLKVNELANGGDILTNKVCLWAENGAADGGPGEVCDTAETTVKVPTEPYFDLSINKTAPATVMAGEEISYVINWSVSGNMTASATEISDTLPAGVSFVSASDGGVYDIVSGTVSWDLGDVAAGTSGSFSLVVLTNELLLAGTVLENNALITSGDETASDIAETLVANYELFLKKIVDKVEVNPGEELNYTVDYEVSGNATSTATILTDALPTGVSFVSASDGGVYDIVSGTVIWDLGDVAAGTSGSITIKVQVLETVLEGFVLINNAEITSGGKLASDSAETTVTVLPYFNLNISKIVNKESVVVGEEVIYTINWEVAGTAVATSTIITDTLPMGTSLVAATPTFATSSNQVIWNLGDITPNATGTLLLTLKVDSLPETGSEIVNEVEIASGDKIATAEATVAVNDYDLTVNKNGPSQAMPGEEISYTIDYEVMGNTSSPATTLTDTLPAGVTFKSASNGPTVVGNIVTWDLGDLPALATGTVSLIVTIDGTVAEGTELTNSVVIKSNTKEATDNFITTVSSTPYFNLKITKSAPAEVTAGNNISYNINWQVEGNLLASGAVIIDKLPSNASFVSATGTYTYNTSTNEIIWNLGDLLAPTSGSLSMVMSTAGDLSNGTKVINKATFTAGGKTVSDDAETNVTNGGGCIGCCSGSCSSASHRVFITKSGPLQINAGDDIFYTLDWSTAGSEPAIDVIITDTLPTNTIFYSASGNYTYATDTRQISWKLGDIWPVATGSLSVILKTDAGELNNNDQLTNKVKIQSGWETAESQITTKVVKGGGPTPVPAVKINYIYPLTKVLGEQYSEEIEVINIGEVVLTNGILSIDLPEANIKFISALGATLSQDEVTQKVNFAVPNLNPGESFKISIVIEATKVGVAVVSDVMFDSNEADARASGSENIITITEPTPEPEQTIVVSGKAVESKIVIAPASTTSSEECETCQTCVSQVCEGCRAWLWLIIALLHGLGLLIYWFYASREEIKENEDGEYYIIKGNWAWALPVLLVYVIVYLLLIFACHLAPWWLILVLIAAFYLALAAHQLTLKKAEIKFSPALPILVTLMVIIAYLFCANWPWWVWTIILILYVLTLASYYLLIAKMNEKSRTYWWLSPMFLTMLVFGLLMVLRLCQCQEVIK